MQKPIKLTLPYPPSINSYYGRKGARQFIKPPGEAYRNDVREIVEQEGIVPIEGRCTFFMAMYPPDRRRRDMDNVKKALWDALTKAGVWADDSDVVEVHEFKDLERDPDGEGWVEIEIVEHNRPWWDAFKCRWDARLRKLLVVGEEMGYDDKEDWR